VYNVAIMGEIWNKFVGWYREEIKDEDRDHIWHKRPLSAILLFVGAVTAVCLCFIPPFAGASVILLGIAAAAMAIVGELRGIEKAAWILLLFAFAGLELRAIREDKNAQDEIQRDYRYHQELLTAQQMKNFQTIGGGIQASIKKSDEHFDATSKRTNQVLMNITGGNSFAYVVPQNFSGDQFLGVVWNNGEQPLVGLTLTIAHTSDPVQVWGAAFYKPIFIGTIAPHDHAPIPNFVFQPRPSKDSGQDNYWIMLSAQNGTAQQSLYFRRNKLHPQFWAYTFNVVRAHYTDKPQKEKMLTKIDDTPKPGPRQEILLFRDWSDDMEERLLKTKQHPRPSQ
jgi:hypothetical protein